MIDKPRTWPRYNSNGNDAILLFFFFFNKVVSFPDSFKAKLNSIYSLNGTSLSTEILFHPGRRGDLFRRRCTHPAYLFCPLNSGAFVTLPTPPHPCDDGHAYANLCANSNPFSSVCHCLSLFLSRPLILFLFTIRLSHSLSIRLLLFHAAHAHTYIIRANTHTFNPSPSLSHVLLARNCSFNKVTWMQIRI